MSITRASKAFVSGVVSIATLACVTGCASTAAIKQDYASVGDDIGSAVVLAAGAVVPSFDDDTVDCDWGRTSVNPVIVANTYDQAQAFTITINDDLAEMVNWVPFSQYETETTDGALSGCNITAEGNSGTFTVTMPPNTAGIAGYLVAGGSQFGINTPSSENHNLAIGAGGAQWYDYWLHTNDGTFSFQNFTLNYGETGGTDTAQNIQTALFNGVVCEEGSDGIAFEDPVQLTTPYADHVDNAWEYDSGTNICFAFLQPGSAG